MSDEKTLEDFFAKKDKSKKNKSKAKGKTKFMTTGEIAKNLVRDGEVKEKRISKQDRESREKKEKEKKAAAAVAAEQNVTEEGEENANKPASTAPTAFPIGGDDEWNEFEDPSKKDYSGLKVQSLQISAEPEELAEEEEEGELEMDENGDMVKTKSSGVSGPWNKSKDTTTTVQAEPEPVAPAPQAEVIKPEALKNVTKGKYVPPSRRGGPPEPASTPSRANRHNKGSRTAPSIKSDLEFPSLAASSDIAKYSDKNDDKNYREVRRGGAAADNSAGYKPGLELGNRYSALGNN